MKKLLVLAVILSVTAMANAMVLSIAVGGDTGVSEITVLPSGELVLAVHADVFNQGDGITWGLVVYSGDGTIIGTSGIVTALAPNASFLAPEEELLDWANMFGYSGVYGGVDTFEVSPVYTTVGGLYFDEIVFQAGSSGTVTVQLIETLDFETYDVVDSLSIIIIPEPATIALLCLGGLLIRKKK
ncbi:MAG: hypothetical protein CVV39_06325 [Planctomycetes bacterium HGW-Planctomycetes-1]|nr:MAG: hypothetical protein CVV39_06325 [Planctomycetes bacterium HGW-Planctomycetes-1]